jgi:excisionase family DNA binding protein
MDEQIIIKKLEKIHKTLREQTILKKEILSIAEAAAYLSISTSAIYKKTSNGEIPFYKPNGKQVYFKKIDLDKYVLQNKALSDMEIAQQVDDFMISHKSTR